MKAAGVKRLVTEAVDRLITNIEAGQSGQLKAYLAMLGRFHRYSAGNVLLIGMQCPEASRVAGYRTWQSLGRQVRRGQRAIHILAPVLRRAQDDDEERDRIAAFKTACVFDVSQTEGRPLPEFSQVAGDPGLCAQRLEALVRRKGIALEHSARLGGAEGLSCGGRIVLKKGMPPAMAFSVLAHELAHEMLHGMDAKEQRDRRIRETEAEAVAFVVCQAVGLETRTAASDYIQLYRGDRETLMASLGRIQRTAGEIIRAMRPVGTTGSAPNAQQPAGLVASAQRPAA